MSSCFKQCVLSLILVSQFILPTLVLAQEKITIGILAFRPKPIVEAKWQPLADYLNKQVNGIEFQILPLNYTELELQVEQKQIDFVFTNSAHYVQLASRTNLSSPLVTLINKKGGQAVHKFGGSILIDNNRADIQTIADLKGKIIATPSSKSFGGFKMQAYELEQFGINVKQDINIIETTMPHDKAVQSVIAGEADAAFVRSGVLEILERTGNVTVGELRVLNLQKKDDFPFLISTRLYPEWPLTAMPHVGQALAGQVAGALLALPYNGEVTNQINIYGFRIPADYEPVREVLRTLQVYPYDTVPQITLADLWEQYQNQITIGIILISIIGGLSLLLLMLNRKLHDSYLKLQGLNESNRIAAVAFDTQEGIFITDSHQNIIRVNNAFTQLTGYSSKEIIGKTPKVLKSGRHKAHFYEKLWNELNNNGYWQGEIWNRRKNGEIYPVGQTITAIKNEESEITHYLATFNDISLVKKNEARIESLAFYDPLTDLANRRLLQDHLKQARAHSSRNNDFFAVLFIDLDHFKTLNDTLGHDYGDELLVQVAKRLLESVREVDTVARPGGDEFIILLEKIGPDKEQAASKAKLIADNILTKIALPYIIKDKESQISASIGISIYSDHKVSIEEMMIRSDLAMYKAKARGRNNICFFDPSMQAAIQKRSELERGLREAVNNQEFVLFYQPKVNQSETVLGFEALIRWQHPSKGLMAPGFFIEAAENCGLIVEIGQWVIRQACLQLHNWAQHEETKHLSIAVNISEHQLRRGDFVETTMTCINRHSFSAENLELEITESILMSAVESAIFKIEQLRNLGVTFAIDDFGTGYSSLNYLKKLPIDWLKIDQSFVREMLEDPKDAAIVKTILTLANTLNLKTIAEGVETEAQRDFLIQLGCPVMQGYLFDKPKPLEQLQLKNTQKLPPKLESSEA